jgi:hypothetical protein
LTVAATDADVRAIMAKCLLQIPIAIRYRAVIAIMSVEWCVRFRSQPKLTEAVIVELGFGLGCDCAGLAQPRT